MENKRKRSKEEQLHDSQIMARTNDLSLAYNDRLYLSRIKNGIKTFADKSYYVCKLEKETEENYEKRLGLTEFFNITEKAGEIYATMPLQKGVQISAKDDFIKSLVSNFTSFGDTAQDFAIDHNENGIWDGMSHVFVDLPSVTDIHSNPYCWIIDNDSLLGLRYDAFKNITHLRFITYFEDASASNPYDTVKLKRVWVFNQKNGVVTYEYWDENQGGGFDLTKPKTKYVLNYIPLASFFPKRPNPKAPTRPRLPLESLARKNVQYFRSDTDQRNILHVCRVPILFGKGFEVNENGMCVGASMAILAGADEENLQADLKYVEPSGVALQSGRQDLIDILQQCEVLGLSVINKKSNITATASNIDNNQNSSVISSYATRLRDSMTRIVKIMIDLKKANGYIFKDESFDLQIETDFSSSYDQAKTTYMQFLAAGGYVSSETATNYGKKLGVLDSDYDFTEDQEKIMDLGLTQITPSSVDDDTIQS